MKLNHLLALLVFLIVSCKPSSDSKNTETFSHAEDKLFFSIDDHTKDKSKDPKFSNSFSLHDDRFLSIHFRLDQPLVHSLKSMEPNLNTEQLLDKGNFQFSFLVDGEIIYVENLDKGAGLVNSKTEQLQHHIPLVSPKQLDFWGWFMWLKFMKLGGGQDALSEGVHTLDIEVRPYLQGEALKTGPVLAKGSITITVPPITIDESLVPLQAIQANSGWSLSRDSFNTAKIEALNRKIAEKRFEHINSIIVIKEGKLLIEEYFNGETREHLHDPRSVGKSFASSLLGIAIKDQYIKNEQALLKDFYDLKTFKNYSPKKDSVTLKSFLTMSSGFLGDDNNYNSPGNEENMYPTSDWVKFALDLPMREDTEIGKDFAYFTAGVVVLGAIIDQSVPEGLVAYADKKLFRPLNITNYEWEYTPQNVGNTAGGIRLRALDFAKYGQLYKNKGLWNNHQILDKQWVEKSLGKNIAQPIDEGHYGYLFWNKTFHIGNTDYEVSYCSGRGGNKIFIFKDIPYVVTIMSSAYNLPNAHQNVDKMMTDYILPALINE